MSERLDGKKQLEEMLNRPIRDWSKDPLQDEYDHVDSEFGPFASDDQSIDFATYLQMQSMQHQIDELTQKLSETQKDLSFRRDLYALQDQLADQLRKDLIEARAEAKKWKDNHDNQVKTNQLLRDRPDLGHRAKSVDSLIKQRDELMEILVEILDALGATHKPHELEGYGITCERAKEITLIAAVKGGSYE